MADNAPKTQNVRRDLNVVATAQELATIKVVLEKKDVARQAIQTNQFPQGTDTSIITSLYSAAMNNFAEATYLEKEWWKAVMATYKFAEKTYCDIETGMFYTLDQVPVATASPEEQPAVAAPPSA